MIEYNKKTACENEEGSGVVGDENKGDNEVLLQRKGNEARYSEGKEAA